MVGPLDGTTVRLVELQLAKDAVALEWNDQRTANRRHRGGRKGLDVKEL